MCGIAGFAHLNGSDLDASTRPVLEAMAQALRPRGPDDMQFIELGQAAMSFTRLSLVDPVGGRQPFVSRDGLVALSANGEIYNHRELRRELGEDLFRSRSDCEVLLHLYERDGLEFLDRVRGMFGIAVIDLREQRLVLARDRIGLKPLFVHRSGDTLVFGSEVKALFQHPLCPRELDWAGALADQGLNAAPIIPGGPPRDWFVGIEQIEPGTVVTYGLRDGSTRTKRYWSMPGPVSHDDVTSGEVIERFRALLAESVQECLVADAEVGLMLSGGVDSAGIAALGRDTIEHSFSALSASTLLNSDADYARATAKALGLTHHELAFEVGGHPSPDVWRRLLWLMESPLCGPEQHFKSEVYRFVRASRPEMKAVLLGSGADELSGGYSRMLAGGGDWHDFIRNLTDLSRRRALAAHAPAMDVWWQSGRPLVSDEAVRLAFPGSLGDVYDDYVQWKVRDWQQYNFWVEDRTASGNAVEARVPYLDHRIVELLASVPRKYRQELFWDKQIIRRAFTDLLPLDVTQRPKIAFYEGEGVRYTHLTFAQMLAADSGELLEQALSSPRAAQFLNADHLRSCLNEIIEGSSDTHLELLLRLVNLGLLDEMTQSLPPTRPSEAALPVEVSGERSREEQRELVFGRPTVDSGLVLRLGDDVLLLDGADGQSFVAMNGELRFVIDHDTDAAWLSVLRGLDGATDLGSVCARADCELESVTELVDQSLLMGLLVRVAEPALAPAVS
ncbi:asparagine synthase (glutamine-hydrolyzing) [Streptomyces sp. NPDC005492]|uniref:asparagine synthase (glutamine-hydrolyzing) n=1 Tax=Streptomyces sp. NPDC005492 TaxID=3156883 RepID=UPI0033BB497B